MCCSWLNVFPLGQTFPALAIKIGLLPSSSFDVEAAEEAGK
jgi:hypothetical protein